MSCGAALTSPAPERWKLATLVFCDLSGSTAMGERLDAEAVRTLMLSYFHEMRGALERHGGTVEKFVGDAVLAVFGVPEAHEDDALRACRAALEMQARLGTLNEELEQRFGTRIALNTPEMSISWFICIRALAAAGAAPMRSWRAHIFLKPGSLAIDGAYFHTLSPVPHFSST